MIGTRWVQQAAIWLTAWVSVASLSVYAQAQFVLANAAPPLKRLPPEQRIPVLAALAGLIILGFGMVALIWLGARVTQRYRNGTSYFQPTPRPSEHDWAAKPLAGPRRDEDA
jgi:hypothetical protein